MSFHTCYVPLSRLLLSVFETAVRDFSLPVLKFLLSEAEDTLPHRYGYEPIGVPIFLNNMIITSPPFSLSTNPRDKVYNPNVYSAFAASST